MPHVASGRRIGWHGCRTSERNATTVEGSAKYTAPVREYHKETPFPATGQSIQNTAGSLWCFVEQKDDLISTGWALKAHKGTLA